MSLSHSRVSLNSNSGFLRVYLIEPGWISSGAGHWIGIGCTTRPLLRIIRSSQRECTAVVFVHFSGGKIRSFGCPALRRPWTTLEEEELSRALNTLQHVITKKSHNVLSKFTILCWSAFIVILRPMRPVDRRVDTPIQNHRERSCDSPGHCSDKD